MTRPKQGEAGTPKLDSSVHEIFDKFFSSDPKHVAALSNYEEGMARLRLARKWVDQYELGVKGVGGRGSAATPATRAQAPRPPAAATTRARGASTPAEGREVTTMFKQPKGKP